MNKEVNNGAQSNNEEVDLIKLLNYFKSGIKSIFKKIWKVIEVILYIIILLKKNWIIILGLVIVGAAFGFYQNQSGNFTSKYEMVLRSNPKSNLELYALAQELQNLNGSPHNKIKNIGIKSMQIEAIEMNEDIIDNYFNLVEGTSFRGDQTDTLYFKAFELKDHKSNMTKYDFTFQKIIFSADIKSNPMILQSKFLDFVNNLPGIKREQQSRLNALMNYEKILQNNLDNIDSLLAARAEAHKNAATSSNEQVLVNTTSRSNVETDLLRYAEVFSRKLFGTQKLIAENQKGVQVISQLKLTSDSNGLKNPIIKYSLIGFVFASIVVILIQFNKYLVQKEKQQREI